MCKEPEEELEVAPYPITGNEYGSPGEPSTKIRDIGDSKSDKPGGLKDLVIGQEKNASSGSSANGGNSSGPSAASPGNSARSGNSGDHGAGAAGGGRMAGQTGIEAASDPNKESARLFRASKLPSLTVRQIILGYDVDDKE